MDAETFQYIKNNYEKLDEFFMGPGAMMYYLIYDVPASAIWRKDFEEAKAILKFDNDFKSMLDD